MEGGGAVRLKVGLAEAAHNVDKEEGAVLAGSPHLGQLPEPLHRDEPGCGQALAAAHKGADQHPLPRQDVRPAPAPDGHKVLSKLCTPITIAVQ